MRDGRPRAIFEDDIEALGSANDVSYALRRCGATSGCDVAFLGVGMASYLLSHAYYVTPAAASMLLRGTKELCNLHGQDYAIQALCLYNRTKCTLPPRGLYSPHSGDGKAFQGWGLYVQNVGAVPSYNSMINFARGKAAAANWSRAAAESFQRC